MEAQLGCFEARSCSIKRSPSPSSPFLDRTKAQVNQLPGIRPSSPGRQSQTRAAYRQRRAAGPSAGPRTKATRSGGAGAGGEELAHGLPLFRGGRAAEPPGRHPARSGAAARPRRLCVAPQRPRAGRAPPAPPPGPDSAVPTGPVGRGPRLVPSSRAAVPALAPGSAAAASHRGPTSTGPGKRTQASPGSAGRAAGRRTGLPLPSRGRAAPS